MTRIGENTHGVFCDILGRHLPNGVHSMEKGQAFDLTGIPPDIEMPVFTDAEIGRKDGSMAKAVQVLSARVAPTR